MKELWFFRGSLTVHCCCFSGQAAKFFIANLFSEGFQLSPSPPLPRLFFGSHCLELLVRLFFFFLWEFSISLFLKQSMQAEVFGFKTCTEVNPDIETCLMKVLELSMCVVSKAVFRVSYGSSSAVCSRSEKDLEQLHLIPQGHVVEGQEMALVNTYWGCMFLNSYNIEYGFEWSCVFC